MANTCWIKTNKYIVVWWEMIFGKRSSSYSNDLKSIKLNVTDHKELEAHNSHAANTNHVKEYIDFAAEDGFGGVLVEGWNTG